MMGSSLRTLAFALLVTVPLHAEALQDYLHRDGKPPIEYLLSKLADHRVVIVGEAHWQRKDEELIGAIVAELRRRNVALATEMFAAESQADIDALISAPEWNATLANAVMRAADWPYVQYRDILQSAWKANRAPGAPPLKIIALGPPADFREKKISYDKFMAERVVSYATDDAHRVLVHCGMHHAFTRFLQVERRPNGRASEFMDRMGNILWRTFGENVFLVALHRPEPCGGWDDPWSTLCAPLGGAIDCAATRAGGNPVGFDVLHSPIAEVKFDERSFYVISHPLLRLVDFTDGYIWQVPVDDAPMVALIPLAEYSPTDATDEKKLAAWRRRADDYANPMKRPSWKALPDWRASCAPVESPHRGGSSQ